MELGKQKDAPVTLKSRLLSMADEGRKHFLLVGLVLVLVIVVVSLAFGTIVTINGVPNQDCIGCGGGGTANQNIRTIGAGFDGAGSALSTGKTAYVTIPYACTIAAYNITVDTGTISFDVWKVATGTAVPVVGNSILTGGFLALSTGTALHSASTSLFTSTTVTANDIVGINIEAVSGATQASLVLQCNATT